jgi:membrane protease YdiL (CAAX protease family)
MQDACRFRTGGISTIDGRVRLSNMPRRSEPLPGAIESPDLARSVSLGTAFAGWLTGWLTGNILGSIVLAFSGQQDRPPEQRSVWLVGVSAVALWTPQLVVLVMLSRRNGSGRVAVDFRVRFAPIDALGVPLGVLSQIALVAAVYAPLRYWWPSAFSTEQLERNARDLYDRAQGPWIVVLIIVVVFGAPLVEELVYRGLIHQALSTRLTRVVAVIASAAFFALIHFRPIEYPGLFAFGLVLGACMTITNRIGMAIVAHMAFNATALVLVAR